ncbi:biliverdin-producing heme oxygenase [Agrobacterium vitis]|uniref:Heme oxygenase n=1 Tax=Agrobacterium vitis TaxID=373 RepID=A0A109CSI8_AGRVI|nr:biliverdin-producing heme oxygenase [Agrobacterium vitis]KAA3517459.1 heme oxygenase [Agrobacterium vitis]KAA3526859.1 heme oxygenase [Agrobacterium vitis]MCE6074142.1 heme oxygenase [Agrobacterium vitis]MCF1477128.1 biliverdin-producing heme oxygenase [Agrobacterium vitis]MCM2451770.1 biliverdin-producing heme oxygenase [Agrobacterium vitis]
MPFSPRRRLLKEATADAHAELDAVIGDFSSPAAYRAYLLGMARFRLPLEEMIAQQDPQAPFISWQGTWKPVMIGHGLRADLQTLELEDERWQSTVPQPEAAEDWLGLFYVLEGSALGAKLLAKRAALLGYGPTHGGAHLFAQAGNFSSWPAFLDLMEELRDLDEGKLVAFANATFAYAYAAFESPMNASADR